MTLLWCGLAFTSGAVAVGLAWVAAHRRTRRTFCVLHSAQLDPVTRAAYSAVDTEVRRLRRHLGQFADDLAGDDKHLRAVLRRLEWRGKPL